ncbi:serine/threonine-protein kinase [Streptomyces sp. NPDC049744]|uniref:serine/threonine-protein kinase n=1 Tax=Streptomyces sp. NPDC049744 TaxID=3154359 RepID=UPI00343DBBA7
MRNQDSTASDASDEQLIAGRYRLLAVLGEGGMGTVWRARDEALHREVAVKEVRASADLPAERSAQMYTRLEREAWAAARISARGVVTVFDVATYDGRPWIVMELVRGRSLADVIAAQGVLPPREAARIGAELLRALCAAHQAGVLHRDVKPANVLLTEEGRVVLTDFGIATVEGDTALTLTGEVVGSPEYVAPERALGRTPNAASDLWSLGVLLYTAVQGCSPFRRTTALATLRAIVDDELPPPHRAGPLTSVIQGLTRKDPEDRMTAEQAGIDLRRAIAASAVSSDDQISSVSTAARTLGTAVEELPTAPSVPEQTSPSAPEDNPIAAAATEPAAIAAHPKAAASAPPPVTSPALTESAASPAAATYVATYVATTAPAALPPFSPPAAGGVYGPVIEPSDPGSTGVDTAVTPAWRKRRTTYLIGSVTAVLVLVGGGLTYAFVRDTGGGEDGAKGRGETTSHPVSVTVAGGATAYEGVCPPGESQAPWFEATFTAARPPLQFSYRWVSESGAVVDREWRVLTFREGDPVTKRETVRLSTYARGGTLRSAMSVEIRSPFHVKSNAVAFSVTCRPGAE